MKKIFFTAFSIIFLLFLNSCGEEKSKTVEHPDSKGEIPKQEPIPDIAAYIGITHPPEPEGVFKIGGALAGSRGTPATEIEYSFQDVKSGDKRMLWLSKFQGRDSTGEATWKVLDIKVIPQLNENDLFMISECFTDEKAAVAAIVEKSDEEFLTGVKLAWTIDRKNEKLIELDPETVQCRNVGLNAP